MLLQPEIRPISHEQLVLEVKGIYAVLVMIDAKCININERQSAVASTMNTTRNHLSKYFRGRKASWLHNVLLPGLFSDVQKEL